MFCVRYASIVGVGVGFFFSRARAFATLKRLNAHLRYCSRLLRANTRCGARGTIGITRLYAPRGRVHTLVSFFKPPSQRHHQTPTDPPFAANPRARIAQVLRHKYSRRHKQIHSARVYTNSNEKPLSHAKVLTSQIASARHRRRRRCRFGHVRLSFVWCVRATSPATFFLHRAPRSRSSICVGLS